MKYLNQKMFCTFVIALCAGALACLAGSKHAVATRMSPLTLGYGVNLVGNHGYYAQSSSWASSEGLDYYLRKGMRSFRIAFNWEWIQPKLRGELDSTVLSAIDREVAQLTAAGATVIIDVHNSMRRDIEVNGTFQKDAIIGQTSLTATDLTNLWVRLAIHFEGNPRVVFGIMNEPHDMDVPMLIKTYKTVLPAIRAAGAKNLILVQSGGWGSSPDWAQPTFLSKLLQLSDPNLAFDVHYYFDQWSAGQKQICIPGSGLGLGFVTAWAKQNHRRLFLGEFSAGNNAACMSELKTALATVTAAKDVWLGLTWWGSYAGQKPYNTPDSFWYTLDPGGGDVQNFSGAVMDDPRLTTLVTALSAH